MGANARRRHGAVIMMPKQGTPPEDRAIQQVFRRGPSGLGYYPSGRQKKRLAARLKVTNPTPIDTKE